MTQIQPAPGADPEAARRNFRPNATPPGGPCGHMGPTRRDLVSPAPDTTVSALDRLIARIETGTATPEDVDHLPQGVVEYLHAVLTLHEVGVLDQDWEVTPTDGILMRGTGSQPLPTS